jgi:hypothetical protein
LNSLLGGASSALASNLEGDPANRIRVDPAGLHRSTAMTGG